VLVEEGRGETPLWIGPGVGWLPIARLRLGLGVELPLTSVRRFDGRVVMSSVISF
jgi:hypothetical protein